MRDTYADHAVNHKDARYQLRGYPIISDQISREGLEVVCSQLERVLAAGTPGHVVEFGCYIGTTSLFIRRLLDSARQSAVREFHVYDSFEGLPEKGPQDNNAAGVDFVAGKLYASKKGLLQQFKAANLQPPLVHKGWFNELRASEVPEPIAFAFLDGDFYDSILSSLRLVWPRMSKGGIIVIDDYQRETLPGVERAMADFFRQKPPHNIRAAYQKAIIEV